MKEHIHKAIAICGSQAALAKKIGVTQAAVSKWICGGNIDPRHAPAIERATEGQVTRSDLFPDLWPAEDRAA